MRLLHKIGAGIMVAGFFLVLAGGMSVRRGPSRKRSRSVGHRRGLARKAGLIIPRRAGPSSEIRAASPPAPLRAAWS